MKILVVGEGGRESAIVKKYMTPLLFLNYISPLEMGVLASMPLI